jgi:phospholipid-transporting ATPase
MCTYEKVSVVLVCRVSPQQKADVVQMVKNKMPHASTLAIGDGANDVSMITAAHIGIGISGLEGQQAARAADYSIGQFKMLKNLLFCHGREAYRRNTYLIMYMFYKNIILVIPVWCYGWFSLFSGTMIYNNVILNLYNLVLTAIPIIWFAIFDWEHTKQKLLDSPKLYIIGMEDVYFNSGAFWRWFSYAVWQGILIVFCVLYTFNHAVI